MTTTQHPRDPLPPIIMALGAVIVGTGLIGYMVLKTEESVQRNAAIAAFLRDEPKVTSFTNAGYRLSAQLGGSVEAHCDRRSESGPLACDPPPHIPGVEIRIASR